MSRLLTRGELAREAQVNLATVRYYERRGLLTHQSRSPGGYHHYHQETVRRLRFIKRSQELGFTLNEIAELLDLRLGSTRVCHDVKGRAEAKRAEVKQKIRDLQRMEQALTRLIDACDSEAADDHCPLLDALDQSNEVIR